MPTHRISLVTATALLLVAAAFWGIQAFLDAFVVTSIVAALVGLIADVTFFLWFMFLGVSYKGKRGGLKLGSMIGAAIIEVIPFLDAIPALIAGVAIVIVQTRMEDSKKIRDYRAREAAQPVNARTRFIREQAQIAGIEAEAANDDQEELDHAA